MILLGSAFFLYGLLITVVFVLLRQSDAGKSSTTPAINSVLAGDLGSVRSLLNDEAQTGGYKGILLPLGPNDNRLPGFPVIWKEFLRDLHVDGTRKSIDGFDGFQAVGSVADLSKGAATQLYISENPLQAFLRGQFLLVLNKLGNVQVIDCVNPRAPKVSGALPYQRVQQLELQGDIAYLHVRHPGVHQDSLIIVDLANPLKPREINRFRLPDEARFFFFLGRQLVVYTNSRGFQGEHFVHLFDLAADFQPIALGKVKSPPLVNGFIKYDRFLLAPDLRAGLNVYDFRDPLQPVLVASLVFPDTVKRLSRHGAMVFALGAKKRIYTIDLHDPLHPVLAATVEEANHSFAFMKVGPYSYFFSDNGYLRVFGITPYATASGGDSWPAGIAGELVPTQTGDGFALLGSHRDSLPAVVTDVLTLQDQANVIDTLFWQGFLVVLGDDGLVRFFRKGTETSLKLRGSLQLPPGQHWVTASDNRLYVGGAASISVIVKGDDGHFTLSGQIEFSGEDSWDGIVVQQALCVAAGKEGVACFSIADPDRPTANPGWTMPQQLESQVNVRQLASPGGDRLLSAGGAVGLLSWRLGDGAQLQLDGFLRLPKPITTLAVVGDFCLVSTGDDVCVIDIKNRASLQDLGSIAFPGVTAFAVAAPDSWAGYVPGTGWSVLSAPRLLLPGEADSLQAAAKMTPAELLHGRYRLNLFNDHEVITVPGAWAPPSLPGDRTAGAAHGLQ